MLVSCAAIAVAPAAAATPIVNGGFETGDFTGWTLFTPGGGTAVLSGGAPLGTY